MSEKLTDLQEILGSSVTDTDWLYIVDTEGDISHKIKISEFKNMLKYLQNPSGSVKGDILYHDGSNWVKLAAGTSGDFLKTQGSGNDPVWSTPAVTGGGVSNGTNLGSGVDIFKDLNGTNLRFKSLTSNNGTVILTDSANEVDLSVLSRWKTLEAGTHFNVTPLSTSEISMINSSGWSNIIVSAGQPLKYSYDGSTYRGIVKIRDVSNDKITIEGITLDTTKNLTSLQVGTPELVDIVSIFLKGSYGSSITTSAILDSTGASVRWLKSESYLVSCKLKHRVDGSGNQPEITTRVDGSNQFTKKTVSTSWSTLGFADSSTYFIGHDRDIEIEVVTAETGNGASDLSVQLIFVSN